MTQPLAEALHAVQPVAVPEETEDRRDRNRRHRDQQPRAQFAEVIDERHRPVGIDTTATTARVQPAQETGSLHRRFSVAPRCAADGADEARLRPAGRRWASRRDPAFRPARTAQGWALADLRTCPRAATRESPT